MLETCVTNEGSPLLAKLMYAGVRLGGSRWFPLPWRWGYGYPWLQGVVAPKDATAMSIPRKGPESSAEARR